MSHFFLPNAQILIENILTMLVMVIIIKSNEKMENSSFSFSSSLMRWIIINHHHHHHFDDDEMDVLMQKKSIKGIFFASYFYSVPNKDVKIGKDQVILSTRILFLNSE